MTLNFSYIVPYGVTLLQQLRRYVMSEIASLLRGSGCVLSNTKAGGKTGRVPLARGAGAGYPMAQLRSVEHRRCLGTCHKTGLEKHL